MPTSEISKFLDIKSSNLETGLNLLKSRVKESIRKRDGQRENVDFIEPLVYLLRGSREVREKEKNIEVRKQLQGIEGDKEDKKQKKEKYKVSKQMIKKWKFKHSESTLTKCSSQKTVPTLKFTKNSSQGLPVDENSLSRTNRTEDGAKVIAKILSEIKPKPAKLKFTKKSSKFVKSHVKDSNIKSRQMAINKKLDKEVKLDCQNAVLESRIKENNVDDSVSFDSDD